MNDPFVGVPRWHTDLSIAGMIYRLRLDQHGFDGEVTLNPHRWSTTVTAMDRQLPSLSYRVDGVGTRTHGLPFAVRPLVEAFGRRIAIVQAEVLRLAPALRQIDRQLATTKSPTTWPFDGVEYTLDCFSHRQSPDCGQLLIERHGRGLDPLEALTYASSLRCELIDLPAQFAIDGPRLIDAMLGTLLLEQL